MSEPGRRLPEHRPARGPPPAGAREIADGLLAWYDGRERDVPWRGESDPYRILVAEVMAQQTRIETVRPYYARFTRRFPDVAALAAAEPDEVLKLWEGLGYYARARRLHAAARRIVRDGGGRLPETAGGLRRLPGVGPYTAGAVASLAFGRPEPAIDGNARRVLARLHDLEAPRRAALEELARGLLERAGRRPGALNQALMDLGSHICLPRRPRCAACPVERRCLARARGTADDRPARGARKAAPERRAVAAVVARDGGWLVVRRPDGGLLGGLWDFPGVRLDGASGGALNVAPDAASEAAALRRALAEELGLDVEVGRRIHALRHVFSHFRLRLLVHEARWRGGEVAAGVTARWAGPPELAGLAFPAYCRPILAGLAADA